MKSIILTTDEVRAVLDGTKTMFRIPIKPQPSADWIPYSYGEVHKMVDGEFVLDKHDNPIVSGYGFSNQEGDEAHVSKYQVGDVIYVREAFTVYQTVNYIKKNDGRAFSEISDGHYEYKADFDSIEDLKDHVRLMSDCSFEAVYVKDDKWHSPATMPREAARIFLRVTGVRVERLQDITALDCADEGIELEWSDDMPKPSYMSLAYSKQVVERAFVKAFAEIWNTKYAHKGYPWESGPWVWAIEFERTEKL